MVKQVRHEKPQEILGFFIFPYTSCPAGTLPAGVIGCTEYRAQKKYLESLRSSPPGTP